MPELVIVEDIINKPLTKIECRRKTWRESSKKYYEQNKDRIIKRNLENYHKRKLEKESF